MQENDQSWEESIAVSVSTSPLTDSHALVEGPTGEFIKYLDMGSLQLFYITTFFEMSLLFTDSFFMGWVESAPICRCPCIYNPCCMLVTILNPIEP